MKKYIFNTLLITSIAIALPAIAQSETSQSGAFGIQKVAYNSRNGTVTYYQGIRVRYYPNHVIVADSYNRQVIRSIAQLCVSLGWDTVYITNLPDDLQDYAVRYFGNFNISLNEFGSGSEDDDEDNTTVIYSAPSGFPDYYWNEDDDIDDNSVGFFYPYDGGYHGYGGAPYRRHYDGGYYGGGHYRAWHGDGNVGRDHMGGGFGGHSGGVHSGGGFGGGHGGAGFGGGHGGGGFGGGHGGAGFGGGHGGAGFGGGHGGGHGGGGGGSRR